MIQYYYYDYYYYISLSTSSRLVGQVRLSLLSIITGLPAEQIARLQRVENECRKTGHEKKSKREHVTYTISQQAALAARAIPVPVQSHGVRTCAPTRGDLISASAVPRDLFFACVPPRWGTADAEIKPPPPTPSLVGAQGYQRFPLSESVMGQNIALDAVPAYGAFLYLPSFCFPGSFNFIFSNFSTVECVLSFESVFVLVVGIHFVSPGYGS